MTELFYALMVVGGIACGIVYASGNTRYTLYVMAAASLATIALLWSAR